MNFPIHEARDLVDKAFAEDLGTGDLSSKLTLPSGAISTAFILAKEDGIFAGAPFFTLILERFPNVSGELLVDDGDPIKKSQQVASFSGCSISLLELERTLLNFWQHLGGVATATAMYAKECLGKTQILDTRKTIPGWRLLQKYAVLCGGGVNHRLGLYDMIMLKENHLAAAGGIDIALPKVLSEKPDAITIEVEVENLVQLKAVLKYPILRVLLDNMDNETMIEAVVIRNELASSVQLEASGNMVLERIRGVSATGVDFISVGALTHSVKALDLSMRFQ